MNLHILQTDIRWHDVPGNIAVAERLMATAPTGSPDAPTLYVLPEMWATGFDTSSRPLPETIREHQAALDWMRRAARERRAWMAGSLAVTEGGQLFNRLYLVRPDGTADTYDKRHLFTYGGEDRAFTAGRHRVIAAVGPWRVLLQTCYDLRFPVFARNRNDYDLILYVANWPESRSHAWDILLRARAIENQCYVCGVNRAGRDPLCAYAGGSALIDAYGHAVATVGTAEGTASALPDRAALLRFRGKFPVLRDADPFHMDT